MTWKPADAPGHAPRLVLLYGVVLGTCFAVIALMDGVRLRIGGMPAFLGWILGGLVVWLITVGSAAILADLVRRHHRTAVRVAVRGGRRAASAAGRTVRRHGRPVLNRVAARAGTRWQARQSRTPGGEDAPIAPEPGLPDTPVDYWPSLYGPARRVCVSCGNPENGPRKAGGTWGPLVLYRDPDRRGEDPQLVHKEHFEDESTGYYGKPYQPAPATAEGTQRRLTPGQVQDIKRRALKILDPDGDGADGLRPEEILVGEDGSITLDRRRKYPWAKPVVFAHWAAREGAPVTLNPAGGGVPPDGNPNGENTMSPPSRGVSRISPDRRARRAATQAGGTVPSEWGPVVAQAADFQAESDEDFLDWLNGQVTGMGAYGEGLIDAYETHVGAVGLDPKALAALHDVADAVAHAAEMIAAAKTRFAEHYELPREYAANGGVMPHDGRWVTGEGE